MKIFSEWVPCTHDNWIWGKSPLPSRLRSLTSVTTQSESSSSFQPSSFSSKYSGSWALSYKCEREREQTVCNAAENVSEGWKSQQSHNRYLHFLWLTWVSCDLPELPVTYLSFLWLTWASCDFSEFALTYLSFLWLTWAYFDFSEFASTYPSSILLTWTYCDLPMVPSNLCVHLW